MAGLLPLVQAQQQIKRSSSTKPLVSTGGFFLTRHSPQSERINAEAQSGADQRHRARFVISQSVQQR